MSLYECQDRVQERLSTLDLANPSVEAKTLQQLQTLLNQAESHFDFKELIALSNYVKLQLKNPQENSRLKALLIFIEKDVQHILIRMINQPAKTPLTPISNLHDYVHKQRLRYPIRQGLMPELGNSGGECYGFTLSMADSKLNPYATHKPITFNRTIHEYQKNQNDRKKDQRVIKNQRLTRLIFCPSPKQRAHELIEIASKHIDCDLNVNLFRPHGAHATYLRVQSNGEVRYMDPNRGAYLFKNKEEFITAYQISWLYQRERLNQNFYLTYSVHKLVEDKTLTLHEKKTWEGKLRSLLTGNKYFRSGNILTDLFSHMLVFLISASPLMIVGGLIGGLLFPVSGAMVGSMIGMYLSLSYCLPSAMDGYKGLLGPIHWLKGLLYLVKDNFKKLGGIKREWDNLPSLDNTTLSSTASVLTQTNHTQNAPASVPPIPIAPLPSVPYFSPVFNKESIPKSIADSPGPKLS